MLIMDVMRKILNKNFYEFDNAIIAITIIYILNLILIYFMKKIPIIKKMVP